MAQAVLINLLNPNPYLFWALVTGPILVEAWKLNPGVDGIGFVVAFYAVMVLLQRRDHFGGFLGPRVRDPCVRRALIILSPRVGLAAFFGLYQLWLGAKTLLRM